LVNHYPGRKNDFNARVLMSVLRLVECMAMNP